MRSRIRAAERSCRATSQKPLDSLAPSLPSISFNAGDPGSTWAAPSGTSDVGNGAPPGGGAEGQPVDVTGGSTTTSDCSNGCSSEDIVVTAPRIAPDTIQGVETQSYMIAGPLNVALSTVSRQIEFNLSSYAHIMVRHALFPGSDNSQFHSQYWSYSAMYGLVASTVLSSTGFMQGNGNVNYNANLGFPVGTDQTGIETSQMAVIVEPTGWVANGIRQGVVVTAYPGR